MVTVAIAKYSIMDVCVHAVSKQSYNLTREHSLQ